MKQPESTGQLVYRYVAYNNKGEVVRGKLSAANEESVTELLGYAGYQVANIKKLAPSFALNRLLGRQTKIRSGEIVLFYRQLALLLEAGTNIVTSLELLRSQSSSRTLSKALGGLASHLRNGNQFSAALGKYPEIFPQICRQPLRVGEQTGNLESMLRQIADYLEKGTRTVKSIKSALMMPAITAVVALGVIGVLVTVVLPAFGNLYSQLGAELPLITRLLLGFFAKLQVYGGYLLLSVLAIVVLGLVYVRSAEGRYQLDKLALRLPLLGRINHFNELARCCRSMALLYRAGLPLTEIMPIVIQSSSNKVVVEALTGVQRDMLQGEGLSQPMAKNEFFLPMIVQMVRVGEETGNLDTTLLAVAQNYETEAEDRTRSLINLIPPAMTIAIAVVVGLVALSLVSAMYSIYGQAL